MADPRLRQLKIKTGVVKRLAKEKSVYEKEAETQKSRVEKYKSDGKDVHDIRKQEEVLKESLMMVPDCQRRLAKAVEELNEFLKSEEELKETKEYAEATALLEEIKPVVS
uniref:Tubulin-specific chaperone A n=1 Tax=Tabanus bromius TaxID=304241 RepID=A0A0K8TUG7_TABBR